MTIIEVKWDGPFSLSQVLTLNSTSDLGLYQIYGTHNISGPKTLVYIGQAKYQRFCGRIPQHNWINWDFPDFEIYIGRLGTNLKYEQQTWENQIDIVEKLLVDFCQPPYNTNLLQGLDEKIDNETIVINFGKRFKLPFEVSTFWRQTTHNHGSWTPYSLDK